MINDTISTHERTQVGTPAITNVLHGLRNALFVYMQKNGCGTLASADEVLGLLTRQIAHLQTSIGGEDADEFRKELMELTTMATFALACWDEGNLSW